MTEPIINGVPAASSLPSGAPVSDASAAPAVNADAEQVGERVRGLWLRDLGPLGERLVHVRPGSAR